jgi:hypothetical protein
MASFECRNAGALNEKCTGDDLCFAFLHFSEFQSLTLYEKWCRGIHFQKSLNLGTDLVLVQSSSLCGSVLSCVLMLGSWVICRKSSLGLK